LLNISTRLRVLGGDNVLIGGFIITGTQPKTVVVRGLGPSLPVPGPLADPVIEVHGSSGELLATNDNWNDAATRQQIIDSGLAPANDLESALWGILNPGAYTVILAGKNGGTGVGLIEVYDLAQGANSKLANISTRGFVDTGDNVMIGGFILGGASGSSTIVLRAVGFSLGQAGIVGALNDPTLELHNGNGTLIASNDNWKDTDAGLIRATGLAPADHFESAIASLLAPGSYTAIVGGKSNTTGVALVEAYDLGSAPIVSAKTTVQQVTGAGTSFAVAALGPALTYQWQRLPFGATQWVNVVDGSAYTGSTTNRLTLTETTTAASGDQFRLVVTNPTGTVTSSSEPFIANSLLKDAVSFTGIYPALADVTYPTKAGDVLTISAYPGLVQIFVDPATPEATVANAVAASAGVIVAKIPLLGLYIVQVVAGGESNFLDAVYANAFVIDGTALAPAVRGGDILEMDYFEPDLRGSADPCYQLHGPLNEQILQRSGGSVTTVDETDSDQWLIARDLTFKLSLADLENQRLVVSMSIQSRASGSIASNLDRTGCSDPRCRAIRHQQILFYYAQLEVIERIALRRPDHTANAIVVIIAGNAGIDLDNELAALRQRFPNAFNSVKIVGGVDETGHIIKEYNHLTDNSSNLMVYARGKNVQIGTETCSGTSYAGPEVARVLDYISSHSPGSTVTQVLAAFDQALREFSAQNILPQDANGLTTQAFLDRAVALATSTLPLTGTWVGTWAWTARTSTGCTINDGGAFSMTLTQTGSSYSGSTSGAGVNGYDDMCHAFPVTGTGAASGTISGTTLTLSFNLCLSGCIGFTGTATLNNNTLTASFMGDSSGGNTPGSGSFMLTRQ
jgi:hypothetical protein